MEALLEEVNMHVTSAFWASFYKGLAAPVALFSTPPSYEPLTFVIQPAQCFAVVGSYLSQAVPQVMDERSERDAA